MAGGTPLMRGTIIRVSVESLLRGRDAADVAILRRSAQPR